MTKRPQAVDVVSWLVWLAVAGGLVVAALVVIDRHQLADSWSPMHSEDRSVQPVSFVPVVVVLYAAIAVTALILVGMFRQGQAWTRYALTVLSLGIVLGSFAIMRTAPPTAVRVSLVVAAMVGAAIVVFVWHPSINGYLHGVEHDAEAPPDPRQPTA
ncbi:MAG: hypothetical protein FWE71_13910 [Nocardioidaceae bacterium]|nr:hypothetical protein [Nocardioidaceae bacterium]MCL2614591.1 hypothetical protein [Nocardioidaceae bacterium]